jgi:hypothetical protein
MTTHEEQTITDSADESATSVSEAPRMEDETTPAPAVETTAAEPEPDSVGETHEPDSVGETHEAEPSATHEPSADETLFAGDDLAELRARWAGVQAAFVDDPKDCVQKADVLVSDLVEQLTTGFSQARSRLEEQWSRGEDASTEDLRLALMHYREFFERLLAV